MKKSEAQFTTYFNRWAKHHLDPPAMIEVKHTHGTTSLPYSAVKDHQRAWLLAGMSRGESRGGETVGGKPYKISDQSMGHKPCDVILFGRMRSWVVIKYPKCFVVIDIRLFLHAEEISVRKSLTEDIAREIAEYVVEHK